MIYLDEADAALGEAAGHERAVREAAGFLDIGAVELFRTRGLFGEIG